MKHFRPTTTHWHLQDRPGWSRGFGFDVKICSKPKFSLSSRGKYRKVQIHGEAADDLEWKLLCNEMLPRVMAVGYVGLGTTLTYLLPTV